MLHPWSPAEFKGRFFAGREGFLVETGPAGDRSDSTDETFRGTSGLYDFMVLTDEELGSGKLEVALCRGQHSY
jgi:hypothetical protein